MGGLEEWLPPVSAGTETGLQTAQVQSLPIETIHTCPD